MSAPVKMVYSLKTKCFYNMFHYLRCSCVSHCNVMPASTLSAHKFVVEVDETAGIEYSEKGFLKKHSGQFSQKRVNLPEKLENVCKIVAGKHGGGGNLRKEAASLARYLWSRHAPVSEEELQQRAVKAEQQMEEEDGIDVEQLDEKGARDVLSHRKGKVLKILRSNIYHWEPVTYNTYKGILYMLSKLAPDYAVLHKIFAEIKYREPGFQPTSLLDFGSGLGSVCWAANTIWPDTVGEHYCIDHSADMNALARLLVQDGDESKVETCFKGMFFRQITPVSDKEKYNLVVSAFTLLELPSREERRDMIKLLWRKTLGFLILVENGTKAGFDLIAEARNIVLKLSNKRGELRGHVFAPCPHNEVCPQLVNHDKTPCNFEAYYRPMSMQKRNAEVHCDTFRYSYVVLQKGEITSSQTWPRFVRQPIIRHRHVHCDVCAPSGNLERYTFTFKKNRELYKCAKRSHCGDLLPVKVLSRETSATDDTQHSRDDDDDDADSPSLDMPSENQLHKDNIKTGSFLHTGNNVTLSER